MSRYQETLNYMFDKLPMFTRIGAAAYKADLNNTLRLCEALAHPETKFKSIHVAGTNGKGSCSHMLAAVFQQAGYKTGLYTSPHIVDFRERIRINGQEISEEDVIRFIDTHKELIESVQPSFFEITVAMAFDYFAAQQVDIAIVEVGMGGLLDSTNVIVPELSVITNISTDHTAFLGSTLSEIARQKAGIIKEGIPVVIGESKPELRKVYFAQAVQHRSPLFYAEDLFEWIQSTPMAAGQNIRLLHQGSRELKTLSLDLSGEYQYKNLRTVLTAIELMRSLGWVLSDEVVKEALCRVKSLTGLRGRFDIIQRNPTVILDVSHNEAGLTEVFRQVARMPHRVCHIVPAFARDKELNEVLPLFPRQALYYCTQAQIPRALPYEELCEKLKTVGLAATAWPTMRSALAAVMEQAHKEDLVLVTGTFFTLEEAYAFFGH